MHFRIILPLVFAVFCHSQDVCSEGAEAARKRDLRNAESLLSRCVELRPELNHYLLLAAVYQKLAKPNELYRVALDGLKRFPQEKRFYVAVANHDGRSQDYLHAIEVLGEASLRWPNDPTIRSLLASSHFGLGKKMLDEGRSDDAIPHLRQAAELNPDDIEAQMNLGRALHNQHQRTEALEIFDRLVTAHPDQPLVYFHRGLSYYAMGEFEKAVQDSTTELHRAPDEAPPRLLRGLSYLSLGNWESAETDLEFAAKAMPENAQAQFGLARTLIEKNEFSRAEVLLRKSMELDKTDPGPVNTLMRLLLRQGRHDEAAALRSLAVSLGRQSRSAEPGEIRFQNQRAGTP